MSRSYFRTIQLYLLKNIFLAFFLIQSFSLFSQNIKGVWRGYFKIKNENVVYNFEVQINQLSNNKLKGITYTYKSKKYSAKANFEGFLISENKHSFKIFEKEILEVNKEKNTEICVMTFDLIYKKIKNEEFLNGDFTSKKSTSKNKCYEGKVYLKKVDNSVFHLEHFLKNDNKIRSTKTENKIILKKEILSVIENKPILSIKDTIEIQNPITPSIGNRLSYPDLSNRNNLLVEKKIICNDEVIIQIFDNGIIDNDTISIYIDNRLVVTKKQLTEEPIEIYLQFKDKNTIEIIGVAENLGDVPPNTALVVVSFLKTRFEIPISIDFKNNAKIVLEKCSALPMNVIHY